MSRLSDEADQRFFEKSRKLSPKFPDVVTELERRRRAKENIVARILLAATIAFIVGVPFGEHPKWMAASALTCFVGFLITCWVAGNRAHDRTLEGTRGPLF